MIVCWLVNESCVYVNASDAIPDKKRMHAWSDINLRNDD